VPLTLGFLAPVGMLLAWAAQTWRGSLTPAFLRQAGHSLGLALAAAAVITLAALILRYTERLYPARRWRLLVLASSLGYAVPGAVIAVGVLIASLLADRYLSATQQVLSGSLVALTGAYAVRFMAVGSQTLGAGFAAAGRSHHEAARSLGCGPLATLWRVELPLLRAPLLAAVLLLTVELLKELPLTLILRPFNFETLATAIYRQAGEERVAEAAVPALLLLLAGLLPILLLHRLTLREAPCTCNSKS
jgi:iron(III) transport system permease protein